MHSNITNNLTLEKIRRGNTNIRNPILVSYVAKGVLPYHGLGSGIKLALSDWPQIEFQDDHDGCLFTVTVHRKPAEELRLANDLLKSSSKSSSKTEDQILGLLTHDSFMTTEQLASALGISKRAILKQIDKLKVQGRLSRVDPARGGHWEVIA